MQDKVTKLSASTAKQHIREARLEDFETVYDVFCQVLEEGKTYSYTTEEMTPERALAYWMTAPDTHCYIVEVESGEIGGFYTLRKNRTGRADHVVNGSFIVHPDYRRRGIARMMGGDAIKRAKEFGYKSIQFNFVVSANKVAVDLWKSLGFAIIGTMPKGYRHAELGFVDVYIMHRELEEK